MKKLLITVFIAASSDIFAATCHDAYFAQDFTTASEVCRQQADNKTNKDNWEAPLILGNMYERGYGVPKNFNNAVYWYEMAAKRGNCTAMSNLQLMYANDCLNGSYSCQQSKSYYWGEMLKQFCPVDPKNPNYLSNNARYYSLVSQNRPQDFLPGNYK